MAGPSRSLVEVGISMVLQDGFTSQAGKISSSYSSLMNNMNQWNRAVTQSAGAAFDYGTKLVGGMYEAYKHSAKVSNQVFLTSKISGATAEQSKRLMELTKEINLQTPLTNLDIASGEKFLAMAGNSAGAIEDMIAPAARLASIFDMQLGGKGGVADMMTNIMATFGIASKDAEKTADILGVATTSANISLTDLAQSLQYSGATFRNAGVDLSTAAAAIGVLGDQGIQASSAGTAIANMLRYLTLSITGQKTKGAKMLQALGISREDLTDSYGNLKDLGTLMEVIAGKMSKLSGTAREAAMYNIFGVRGQRASSALFQAIWNGSDKMSRIMDKVRSSEGFTRDTMGEFSKTPEGRIKYFNSAIDNLKVSLGQALTIFTPFITGIGKLANLVAQISNTGFGSWVVRIGAAATISFTVLAGWRLLSGVVRMVVTMTGLLPAKTQAANAGMTGMNTQAAILEAHLRTIVALMAEYVAMSYAPGTRGMMLPMGGRLGRNAAGKPYVAFNKKTMNTATYAGAYGASTAKPPTGSGSGSGSGTATQALGTIGMMAALVGGPWGLGIGLGLTALSVGIDLWSSHIAENTDALEENTKQLSVQEIQDRYNKSYIEAITRAIKNQNNSSTLNLTINGQSIGNVSDGDTIPIDGFGFTY